MMLLFWQHPRVQAACLVIAGFLPSSSLPAFRWESQFDLSISQSVSRSVSQSDRWSVIHSVINSVSQSVSQSVNLRPISHLGDCSQAIFERTRSWKIRRFPKPVGRTANKSPPSHSCRIDIFCSSLRAKDRLIPRWARTSSAMVRYLEHYILMWLISSWQTSLPFAPIRAPRLRANAFCKILGFACKRFLSLLSPPPSSTVFTLVPISARSNSEKHTNRNACCTG